MVMGTGKTLQLGKEWLAFCGPMAMPTGRTQEQVGVKASPSVYPLYHKKWSREVIPRGKDLGAGFFGGTGERGAKKPRAAAWLLGCDFMMGKGGRGGNWCFPSPFGA